MVMWQMFVHVLMARKRWSVAVGTIYRSSRKKGTVLAFLGRDGLVETRERCATYGCGKVVVWVGTRPLEYFWTRGKGTD